MAKSKSLNLEIVYLSSNRQFIIPLNLPAPCVIQQAITLSGILTLCPEIDLSKHKVGIYSKTVSLEQIIQDHDRIEIYRPLQIDPKQARLVRAKATKSLTAIKHQAD
jgi:putative ubiquitin-RnfH superfamily antitoxin RatB of RatAB toxin-antitoxin module